MSKIEFNREPKQNPIFNIQKVFANAHHDARPRLYQKGNDAFDNTWRISFQTESYQHSFEVQINDHAHDRMIHVFAYLHGDQLEVKSRAEYNLQIENIIAHHPHPSGNPDQALTEEEAESLIEDKVMVINERWFWMRVEDCIRRFESAEFLFSM